jgi:hypothetical protein
VISLSHLFSSLFIRDLELCIQEYLFINLLISKLKGLMEEPVMIKELLSKNIVGILGISLATATGLLAYQLLISLFIQAALDSLSALTH